MSKLTKSANININHVRYFLKVYETQSLSQAAKACNVSQPTITKSIQTLEKNFGLPLFHRDTQNVHPSEPAQLLYDECVELIRAANSVEKRIESIKSSQLGEVRIGMGKILSNQFGHFLTKLFPNEFSKLKLSITDGNLPELNALLLNREVDFLLCYEEAQHYFSNMDKISVKEFYKVPIAHVVSPNAPFYEEGNDPQYYPWATVSEIGGDNAKRSRWHDFYNTLLENGCVTYRINSTDIRLQLARQGAAVTVVPRHLVQKEIDEGSLIDLTPQGFEEFTISVYTLTNNPLSLNSKKIISSMKILADSFYC
ncbi:LysR family transcriptional regulator [Vibrio marisflavi]|uniref:HTH-type transcriptional regulator ArgP n=1 Tax=Vibrio marisflavi CECT 7928 TaxID=634439 RepID=A0ABM9A0T6_9VIBR|nr:LysR family transcriptional regulator [Vibrio marisflavi]CAH0536943.1 HTH-type transcriptional regulator ArgP [Vibrio marisflavi CECT 7928]